MIAPHSRPDIITKDSWRAQLMRVKVVVLNLIALPAGGIEGSSLAPRVRNNAQCLVDIP
jgi:hypothetical protein